MTNWSEYMKARRLRARAAGRCVCCHKRKAIEGRAQCLHCSIRRAELQRIKRGLKPWREGGPGRPPKYRKEE